MMKHVTLNSIPFAIWALFLFIHEGDGFSTGAPANSCKDPSTFHTRKLNATHEGIILPKDLSSNPYRLLVSETQFTPGQEISVTFETTDPSVLLEGFFIQAIKANLDIRDLSREAFGSFKNTTSRERPSPCLSRDNVERGGITHTDALPKRSIRAIWVAPTGYDPGKVQFLATGVQNYDTYWTDIRSHALESRGYTDQRVEQQQNSLSPTAVWYLWLHNLLQQQPQQQQQQQQQQPANAA